MSQNPRVTRNALSEGANGAVWSIKEMFHALIDYEWALFGPRYLQNLIMASNKVFLHISSFTAT